VQTKRTRLRAGLLAASLMIGVGACSDDESDDVEVLDPSPSPTSESPEEPNRPTRPDRGPPPVPEVAGTVATGITSPWDIVFLPNDDALVSERDTGLIKRVTSDGEVQTVGELPEVDPSSEGGLLGLEVHPDFETQPYVYAYLSTDTDNRLVRLRWDGTRLGGPENLLTDVPVNTYHDGGRLAFGPDGMLYVATGEAGNEPLSQDLDSPGGKILRLEPDGDIPGDNPYPDSPVWSYGHRNVEGLAFDDDGRLWASEFGEDTWDELNLIEPETNYGWPIREGDEGESCDCVDPVAQWRPAAASPSGLAYADGALWMASLRGERLWRIDVRGDRVVGEPRAYFTGEYGRLRAIEVAPDGSLWLGTSNSDGRGDPPTDTDRILRIALR
jgi:glucose/arabinose dehydrogenase